jgi:Domain of unknown function (DUF6916)
MAADRRRFLQMAGVVPATAVAGVGAASRPGAEAPASSLTLSQFRRCLGERFSFEKAVFGTVAARLSAVDAHPGSHTPMQREGRFSLRFETSGEGTLEQASYRVHHERLGDFVLFVSPKDAQGRTVEAVFNRL